MQLADTQLADTAEQAACLHAALYPLLGESQGYESVRLYCLCNLRVLELHC
jgi:hypothetical protein